MVLEPSHLLLTSFQKTGQQIVDCSDEISVKQTIQFPLVVHICFFQWTALCVHGNTLVCTALTQVPWQACATNYSGLKPLDTKA